MGYNKNIKLKGDEMKVEVKKIEGMERERERGKWWVLFFIIMLSPKISSALDFEEVFCG
jgi:hypothetical protein